MATTETKLAFLLQGQDKTGAAFDSLASRARAAAANLHRVMAGAAAALGIAFSGAALKRAADELGLLSDRAQQFAGSVPGLTRMATAFGVLGIKGNDIESLTAALTRMIRITGETGEQGFLRVLQSVARLNGEQERAAKLQEVFGRAGTNFLPLVRNGAEAVSDALAGVIEAMPGVSDAAANAGDEIADSFAIASAGVKSVWLEAIGSLAANLERWAGTDIRTVAALAAEYLRYAAQRINAAFDNLAARFAWFVTHFGTVVPAWLNMIWGQIKAFFASVAELARQAWNAVRGQGFSWDAVTDRFVDGMAKAVAEYDDKLASLPGPDLRDIEALQNAHLERVEKIKSGIGQIAQAASGSMADAAEDLTEAAKQGAKTIRDSARNSLVDATSYAARHLRAGQAFSGVAGASVSSPLSRGGAADTGSMLKDILAAVRDCTAATNRVQSALANLEAI